MSVFVQTSEGLQAFIYGVASALLLPVLALEAAALVWLVFEVGRFSVELFQRARFRRGYDVRKVAAAVRQVPEKVAAGLSAMGPSGVVSAARVGMGDGSDRSRSAILKALSDAELESARRLERTRMLVRIGPILGLMGTLIPISPALVGLAQGDVETLSSNLVIAFSTTVVGLLVGGVAYVITTVRERHHRQDISDLEFVFDAVGDA